MHQCTNYSLHLDTDMEEDRDIGDWKEIGHYRKWIWKGPKIHYQYIHWYTRWEKNLIHDLFVLLLESSFRFGFVFTTGPELSDRILILKLSLLHFLNFFFRMIFVFTFEWLWHCHFSNYSVYMYPHPVLNRCLILEKRPYAPLISLCISIAVVHLIVD